MADNSQRPIVIKRIKKGGHGHHGGAWKIAYADFVTAMMAFFLLMWLLGSTAKGDLNGIADFFSNPLKVALLGGDGAGDATALIKGGGQDLMRMHGQVRNGKKDRAMRTSGRSQNETNAGMNNNQEIKQINSPIQNPQMELQVSQGKSRDNENLELSVQKAGHKDYQYNGSTDIESESIQKSTVSSSSEHQTETDESVNNQTSHNNSVRKQAAAIIKEMKRNTLQKALEQEKFGAVIDRLREKILSSKALAPYKDQIITDLTNQGLRIQIIDKKNRPMFLSGGAHVEPHMTEVLQALGNVLSEVDNQIQVTGHTDASPFVSMNPYAYDNWDLSAERASSARKELIAGGLRESQVARIAGLSNTMPFDPGHPDSLKNRRISILLMTKEASSQLAHN